MGITLAQILIVPKHDSCQNRDIRHSKNVLKKF